MTDLTEQWKKGELKDGYYYVRDVTYILPAKLGKYDNQFYFSGNEVGYGYEENTELEVLAPVPSYDEYQKLLSDQLAKIEGEEINAELEARLKKTQELELELRKELQDEKEKHMTRFSLRSPADEMVIEKQVWKSTLNRSMVLEAENEQLKDEYEKECHRADELEDSYWKSEKENQKIKELLKEFREEIEKHIPKKWHGEKDETMQKYRNKRELRTKIDEALK